MRAAAILGPGNVAKAVATFQRLTGVEWTQSIEQADAAVIFGGDGTIHHHLSELVELKIPALVVPCGSGNDFARALGIRRVSDSVAAWKKFAARGEARAIDLGVISLASPQGLKPPDQGQPIGTAEAVPFPFDATSESGSTSEVAKGIFPSTDVIPNRLSGEEPALPRAIETPTPHKKYFCCVAGVGIDTAIARRANALPKWLRARGGYALHTLQEIFRFAPFPMRISQNGTQSAEFRPTLLAAVANTPAYGGGMRIAPHAKLDDGKLDLCLVDRMNVFKLFCLFPTVYFGSHLGFREVRYQQTERIRLETELPLDVYADGEYAGQTPAEFSVARSSLKVIVPTQS